jgi:hypothetical protein
VSKLWNLASQKVGVPQFTLCGMVMWTKNDLLNYGLLFECVHEG